MHICVCWVRVVWSLMSDPHPMSPRPSSLSHISGQSQILYGRVTAGVISVFRTHNIEREYDTTEEQLGRLDETIRANVMKRQPGQAA